MLRRRAGLRGRPWDDVDCWVLDLEMSGLERATGRVVAVGMVLVRGRAVRLGDGYSSFVATGGERSMTGVAAHHLLPSDLAGGPPLADVVADIDRRLVGAVLVVHGASIDLPFLRRAYAEAGTSWPAPPVVDTLALWRRHEGHRLVHQPSESVAVTLAAARSGVGLPAHEAHDAFADAVATAELLLVLAHRLGARTIGDLV